MTTCNCCAIRVRDQSLLRILGDARKRWGRCAGADVGWVCVFGWGQARSADPSDTLNLAASNERTAREFRRRGIQAILDDHNQKIILGTTNLGSIHQKMAVADGGFRGTLAFCGGIDLAYKRWDFPAHPAFDSRRDPSPSKMTRTTCCPSTTQTPGMMFMP